ncbi:hypothetical protein IPM19_02970 [bacterium]|nr:MAG: hypothetical protein IPM19_02970 [bacterium]
MAYQGVSRFALVSTVLAPLSTTYAATTFVDVCHKTGNGYNSLSVNSNSLQTHINHGDVYPVPQGGCESLDTPAIPSNTIIITGDTAAGENQPGWMFNRDTSTDTPFAFNTNAASIGSGSLNVLPIGATPADKMVAENFINKLIVDINSISYDFKIGSGGDNTDEEQFYMNVYANFGSSSPTKFYDCRYNVVPTFGSTGSFTTVTFDPTQSYPVTTRAGGDPSPHTCPSVPADMNNFSSGSNIRMFALNVGDTSASDAGLDGYLDKVVVSTASLITTYDFEPVPTPTPVDIEIEKIWQDAQGNPIPAPDNKDDITITVNYGGNAPATCKYEGDTLVCNHDAIIVNNGQEITVTETGLPAGWEVDDQTVGSVDVVCDVDSQEPCTHTVINKLKTPQPCSAELVANGGFEAPVLSNSWDVRDSGTPGLGWSVDWVNPTGAPAIAKAELHRGVNGWDPKSGSQHTELDSDWGGPSDPTNGENGSVKLFQDLITVPGGKYTVKLWTSPRPGQNSSQNVTQVKAGAVVLDTIIEDGTGNLNTVWTEHVYTFTATSGVTRLEISDQGVGDSFGAFVDDVSVKQECLSDVTICKLDNNQNPLSGWEVYLKGPKIETVTVYPDGADYSTAGTLPAGQYVVEASGTYVYRPGDPAASTSDAAYSKRLPSDPVYGGAFAPWVRVNDFPNPHTGWLGIQIDQGFTDWGSTFNPAHQYSTFRTLGGPDAMDFRILDDNYSDNSGSLTVDIYKVLKGTTGDNGCITLKDVPFGTYTVDEVMQQGWSNVSGQGQTANVDGVSDTFTLVNKCDTGCESQVTVCKVNDANDQPLSGWTVFLKGKLVETVSVNSNNPLGATTSATLQNGKQYLAVASGTWGNRSFETVDAKFTTPDGWSTVLDAPQGGYQDELLELQVDDGFVEWGPYNTSHTYNYLMTGSGSTAKFRVYDFANQNDADNSSSAWFGDNVGPLTVKIYEVYSGVTEEDGCVTLNDVPYGTYSLGEIMQDGWMNEDGEGDIVVVNGPVEGPNPLLDGNPGFTLVNACVVDEICNQPEPVVPNLHLIKVVCDSFSDVAGNAMSDAYDATGGNYVYFNNYANGAFSPSPLVGGFVDPEEIPDGCAMAHNWQFLLSTDQDQNDDNQTVATVNGTYTTAAYGPGSALSAELQAGIQNGNFWVSEVTQGGYDFAALRCYDDAFNGDNLEFINLNGATPENIYCIAYNIEKIAPCVDEPISVASAAGVTLSWGVREGSVPPIPTNIGNYPLGSWGFAQSADSTGYPGAWSGSAIAGASYVSNDSTQPTFGGAAGYNGGVESYRLFSHTFTIPAGAININSPVLSFAGDNSVEAYLDDVLVGSTAPNSGFTTVSTTGALALTAGTHTLKFVVKNDAFDQPNNPTGLIYKLDDVTFDCNGGGNGGSGYKISGIVYEDSNANNTKDEGESGLPGWQINIEKLGEEEAFTDSTTSDENGNYQFTGLVAGCYLVTESTPGGWIVTEPDVDSDSYHVAVGGVNNCNELFTDSGQGFFASLFIKTAHAAAGPLLITSAGDAVGVNFGNFDNGRGGNGGNGGSGGSSGGGGGGQTPPPPTGRVLGDSTNTPSDQETPAPTGSVLGATTLPRTGTPASIVFTILGLLTIVLLPKYATVEVKASKQK